MQFEYCCCIDSSFKAASSLIACDPYSCIGTQYEKRLINWARRRTYGDNAKKLWHRDATLETDPAAAEAASKHFGFTPSGQTIIGDARYEIRQLKGPMI